MIKHQVVLLEGLPDSHSIISSGKGPKIGEVRDELTKALADVPDDAEVTIESEGLNFRWRVTARWAE